MGRSNHICMSLVWIILLVVFVWPIAFAVSFVWVFLQVSVSWRERISLERNMVCAFSYFQGKILTHLVCTAIYSLLNRGVDAFRVWYDFWNDLSRGQGTQPK